MSRRNSRAYFWIREYGGLAALRAKWGCGLLVLVTLGATSLALVLSSRPVVRRLGEAVVLVFLWWGAIRLVLDDPPPGLAPYFDRQIGDIHTYSRGQTIARRCPELDQLAAIAGVAPVSSFGFGDDFRGEAVIWHDTAEGIRTFSAILELLQKSETPDGTLREELQLVLDALRKAQDQSARFCLLIVYAYTNAMEHAQRKGSFF